MKVLSLKIKDFARITEANIKPSGKIVKITGPNKAGKSSVLHALRSLIGGERSRPAVPIRSGASSSVVVAEFGQNGKTELTAALSCSPEGNRLEVSPMRQGFGPQALMDHLGGGKAFDPIRFALADPKEQFSILQRIVPLKDKGKPIDPVQLDFMNEQDYNKRTEFNRRVKELEAQHIAVMVLAKRIQSELTAEMKTLDKQADDLTDAMAARIEQKKKAMEHAKMPVRGLAFGNGEVLYNGQPLSQASQAEKIMLSVEIGTKINRELQVMMSDSASLLDQHSWKTLETALEKSKWDGQLWMEVVDTSGEVGIVMEDGKVAKVNP